MMHLHGHLRDRFHFTTVVFFLAIYRFYNIKLSHVIKVVILGAFGCGAFENDPEAVAAAFSNVIARYRRCFRTIELAIYCSPRDEQNYNIFKREIDTILC